MLLLIDNYDSFTYNLVHAFGQLGVLAHVARNDTLTVPQALALRPKAIVLSPGPATPDDAGICLALIKAAAEIKLPLLGVCLGHQALGQALGGRVVRAPLPFHGKLSHINHQGQGIFADLPQPLTVTRYHSLIIERHSCPADLDITAQTDDGLIMAVQHKTLPLHGVQFHPESIATEYGTKLLQNFVQLL